MLAYVYTRYGPPDVLQKVWLPKPVPKADGVVVKVVATTVSSADCRLRSLSMPPGLGWMGRPAFGLFGPRKPVLGTEFAGVIDAIGENVTRFQVGDLVIGFPGSDLGANAEYIVMPADGRLVRKPANMSFENAAALPFGATTAYDFLVNKGKLRAGETVLINGASGSVGCACVQIAKHLQGEVTAVCSAANRSLMLELGADRVIDYAAEDFATGARQYDVIVDTATTTPWKRAKQALRPKGRLLLISVNALDLLFGSIRARQNGMRLITGSATESRDLLETVVAFYAKADLEPVVGRRFTFDQMVAAHNHVDTGRKVGNTVVTL